MLTKNLIWFSFLSIFIINPLFSQEPLLPPDSLRINQQCDEIQLTWQPPQQSAYLILGFNVYLEDSLLQFTQDTAFNINMQGNGFVTFNVTTVYSTGESDPVSIEAELVIYAPVTNLNYHKYQCQFTWNEPQGNLPNDPDPIIETETIQWCDNWNYTSIGTGGNFQCDIAAVWSPSDLSIFNNGEVFLKNVSFFPAEQLATYTIRIWQGNTLYFPDELIYEQSINYFTPNEWNIVILEDSILIDIQNYLWVGYYVNATVGQPAGVDDGPAIDHYGNMMYYNGSWQTLLEINPTLDYNWNIILELSYVLDYTLTYDIYGYWNCENYQHWQKLNEEPLTDTTFWYACINPNDEWLYDDCFVQVNYCDTPINSDTVTCEICWYSDIDDEPVNSYDIFILKEVDGCWLIECDKEVLSFNIYDLVGRMIFQKQKPNKPIRVEKQSFPPGIYLFEVKSKSERSFKKILR